jgi:hypothetical protein
VVFKNSEKDLSRLACLWDFYARISCVPHLLVSSVEVEIPMTWSIALLGTGLFVSLPAARAGDRGDSEPAATLLSQVTAGALQLKSDAFMMVYAATHSNVNLAWHVPRVKEHIRQANRKVTDLEGRRVSLSATQIATIDRVQPLLKELAGNSEAIIRYAEEDPKYLREHKDQIAARAGLSSVLASLIVTFVEYGNARQRLENLADRPDPLGR